MDVIHFFTLGPIGMVKDQPQQALGMLRGERATDGRRIGGHRHHDNPGRLQSGELRA